MDPVAEKAESTEIERLCKEILAPMVRADGGVMRIEELAHQRWDGEKIAEERFYYDPAQMKG